jgi:hypothetical protein
MLPAAGLDPGEAGISDGVSLVDGLDVASMVVSTVSRR